MDSLITDLRWDQVKECLEIPRAVARKFSEFTTWLTDNLGVSAGADAVQVSTSAKVKFGKMYYDADVGYLFETSSYVPLSSYTSSSVYSLSAPVFNFYDLPLSEEDALIMGFSPGIRASFHTGSSHTGLASRYNSDAWRGDTISNPVDGNFYMIVVTQSSGTYYKLAYESWADVDGVKVKRLIVYYPWSVEVSKVKDTSQSGLSTSAPAGVQTPDLADEKDTTVGITGVGDGTATAIEDLLQQILEQLQANTLAPTLDVAGTETGGDTGTDEDSKPYLPYIPQIFEKIKDLPGTLSNIWETVKGIPAAIAEKIGAFFTTLWGWLQNIIDAITALPAAIAEKVGELFKPDEALVTEIVDAFKSKFGFLSTLNSFVNDLFSLTPESDPPVIWVHLENAESRYGYSYGDKQKILDLSWYQKYKASVDGILSGFLWLGYLWLLFKRAPGILNGMSLANDDAPRSADIPDMLNTPRLGAGDGSTMYRGDGFTMRDKGRRGK